LPPKSPRYQERPGPALRLGQTSEPRTFALHQLPEPQDLQFFLLQHRLQLRTLLHQQGVFGLSVVHARDELLLVVLLLLLVVVLLLLVVLLLHPSLPAGLWGHRRWWLRGPRIAARARSPRVARCASADRPRKIDDFGSVWVGDCNPGPAPRVGIVLLLPAYSLPLGPTARPVRAGLLAARAVSVLRAPVCPRHSLAEARPLLRAKSLQVLAGLRPELQAGLRPEQAEVPQQRVRAVVYQVRHLSARLEGRAPASARARAQGCIGSIIATWMGLQVASTAEGWRLATGFQRFSGVW
jgi:hypothetical protein